MARQKLIWNISLQRFPVDFICVNLGSIGRFARVVRLKHKTRDGRELWTLLTPDEARQLGWRLLRQADEIDAANARHDNGFEYDAFKAQENQA